MMVNLKLFHDNFAQKSHWRVRRLQMLELNSTETLYDIQVYNQPCWSR